MLIAQKDGEVDICRLSRCVRNVVVVSDVKLNIRLIESLQLKLVAACRASVAITITCLDNK